MLAVIEVPVPVILYHTPGASTRVVPQAGKPSSPAVVAVAVELLTTFPHVNAMAAEH